MACLHRRMVWLHTHSLTYHVFGRVVTGSIARSATHQYLTYSEADFEFFRPAGATRCTDGGEIWRGGGDQRSGTKSTCFLDTATGFETFIAMA